MANELRFAVGLSVANGNLQASQNTQKQADQATPGVIQRKQTISTGGSTLTLTGVTTPRAILIENLDATNYVDIGPDSSGLVGLIRLEAGECCMFPIKPSVVIKAIANTGNVDIAFLIAET